MVNEPELTCEHAERLLGQVDIPIKRLSDNCFNCVVGCVDLSWFVGDDGYPKSIWDVLELKHYSTLFWSIYNEVAKVSDITLREGVSARLEICPHQLEWRVRVSYFFELHSEVTFDPALVGLLAAAMQGEEGVEGVIWDRIQDLDLLPV